MSGNSPARKCIVLGVKCDSQLEGKRWFDLSMLAKAGEILNLKPHPVFPLIVSGDLVCEYIADAEYDRVLPTGGLHVVEDTKPEKRRFGSDWKIFRLKAKLFRALHGFDIEVWPPKPPRAPRRKRP